MHTYGHLIYPVAAFVSACYLSWQRMSHFRAMTNALVLTALGCCGLHFALGGWRELISALLCAVIATAIYSLVYFWAGIPLQDLLSIGVIALAAGSSNTTALLLFTAIVGALMSFVIAGRRQKITNFLRWRIREATHAPHEEFFTAFRPYAPPELTLRRYYGHAITIGALLTLIQAVTF